jgi:carbamoyl-phosphate synthase large subunit
MNKPRLLILSAGSLLGQNILDAVESRRRWVHVVGANSLAMNPRIFRCDTVYLTPPNDPAKEFNRRLLEIIQLEDPYMILAGRDHDVLSMAALRETHPELSSRLTCGSLTCARIMHDKFASWQFAREHDLPFAETVLLDASQSELDLRNFLKRHSFPALAKPRFGHGSLGVFVVHDLDQVLRLAARGDYVLQPHLSPPVDLDARRESLAFGTPLFFSLPENCLYACQTLIAPDGSMSETFCSVNQMVIGRCERSQHVRDESLALVGSRFARAMAEMGWMGPLNLQCKRLSDGRYVAFEINGRMSGSTSARLLMGFDEVGRLTHDLTGQDLLPTILPEPKGDRIVFRSLSDYVVDEGDVDLLKEHGQWRRSS